MANLLQAITGAGTVPVLLLLAAPLRADFSHRVHLERKIDCPVCHAAAAGSQAAADNLLPKPDVCANCHTGDRKLAAAPSIKSPRKLTVTKFDHRLHVKLGPAVPATMLKAIETKGYLADPRNLREQLAVAGKHPCTGCHRGLEKSDSVSMAAFPHMADCLTCHNTIDPPFSCVKCHDEEQRLKPASHTNEWIDRHSTGKANLDKASCAVCHGRNFTCLGCH